MDLLYAHFNLRWNPFRGMEDNEWLQVVHIELSPLLKMLGQPGVAIQFIGDQGRGKSTHMRALHQHHPGSPFVYLHDRLQDPKPLPKIPNDQTCFIDESQRMTRWSRWRHFRNHRNLILGTHEDHTALLERRGFYVHTVNVHQKDPHVIKLILKRRVCYARRSNQALPIMTDSYLNDLISTYGDDIRSMETLLYDDYMDVEKGLQNNKFFWSEATDGQM